MKTVVTLVANIVLILLAPHLATAQWFEWQEGQLVIRGGWLFVADAVEQQVLTSARRA